MSIVITPDATDDSLFVELIESLIHKLDAHYDPDEVFAIHVKNWFDHKWLNFSGNGRVPFDSCRDTHPQVALDEFFREKTTFPPFTPNRILSQQWWAYDVSKPRKTVHRRRREHSAWNLQRRVTQFSKSALFVWYSSASKSNARGSVLVYRVEDDNVSTWYAAFIREDTWAVGQCKGIAHSEVTALLQGGSHQDDRPTVSKT